jgi:hypothetical protein
MPAHRSEVRMLALGDSYTIGTSVTAAEASSPIAATGAASRYSK